MPKEAKELSPLGLRMQEAMDEMGIKSARSLARELSIRLGHDVQHNYILRLMSGDLGQRIDLHTVFALADILMVEPRWLYLGEGAKKHALIERYEEIQRALRDQIAAKHQSGNKVPGALTETLDKTDRAIAREKTNAANKEREQRVEREAEFAATGTGGRGKR